MAQSSSETVESSESAITNHEHTIRGLTLSPGTRVQFMQKSLQFGTQVTTFEVLPFTSAESTDAENGVTAFPVQIVSVQYPDMILER